MVQESACHSKLSSTCDTLSRENSLTSFPDTECDWPELDGPIRRASTPAQSLPAIFLPSSLPPEIGAGPPGRFVAPGEGPALTAQTSSFQVAYEGGVEVRAGPFDAPQTGLVLKRNEVFAVTQEVAGSDGRVYLCLADGRGWVFDDTNLMPHDPSVVRCTYTAPQEATTMSSSLSGLSIPPPMPPQALQVATAEVLLPPRPTVHPPSMAPPPGSVLLASTPVAPAHMMLGPPGPAAHAPTHPSGNITGSCPVSWFRVAYLGGINLRSSPSINAPPTGAALAHNETFPVAEEIPSSDGRVYLRLCDGRGWAFDDTALMPHDPSVKRGMYLTRCDNAASPQQRGQMFFSSMAFDGVQVDALPNRRRRMYPQPRGKRGGKRCSKRKQAAAAAAGGGIEG